MKCETNPNNCPIEVTLSLIGGKYKALLLWHLTGQTLRFNQLHRLVPEATPKMLTQQLRELEEDGLISPHSLSGRSAPRRLLADGAR